MSINQENYPILSSPQLATSPLYHSLSAFHRSRFNTCHARAPLQTRLTISPNIDISSPEISSMRNANPPRTANKSRRAREPKSSTFNPEQFRYNLETRLREEVRSPSVIEPESSSSQPSEPFSGSYRDSSPFQANSNKRKGQDSTDNMFSEEFYKRINDFLDNEGLELADPTDEMQGIRLFSKSRILDEEEDEQGDETHEIKGVQSAGHSPKLICDNLFSSTLLQRRSSRSQGPGGAMNGLDSLKKQRQGKLNLNVFRHFQDDLNQILQTASPIEEKITPVISRNNSGFYESTPDRLGPKKYSFKHLMSPNLKDSNFSEDSRFKNGLAKYTIKPTQSFKSPKLRIIHTNSINEFSPLKSAKEEKESLVCSSSPVLKQDSSPKNGSPSKQFTRPPRPVKGKVVRKSRFQALRDLQECPPLN